MGTRYTYYKYNKATYPGINKLSEEQFDEDRFAPLDPEILAEIEKRHAGSSRSPVTPEDTEDAKEWLGSYWTDMQKAQKEDDGHNPDTPFD